MIHSVSENLNWFHSIKLDSIFSRQGSVLLVCQSQREGIFREYFGGLQRGRGRRGFNNIYTLNIVPYHQKCFLFVCSSYRGLKKNIISCQRVSNACTAWWFLLRNILVIFCCVQDSVHGLLNENGNIPRPLSPEGVVWVSETK